MHLLENRTGTWKHSWADTMLVAIMPGDGFRVININELLALCAEINLPCDWLTDKIWHMMLWHLHDTTGDRFLENSTGFS